MYNVNFIAFLLSTVAAAPANFPRQGYNGTPTTPGPGGLPGSGSGAGGSGTPTIPAILSSLLPFPIPSGLLSGLGGGELPFPIPSGLLSGLGGGSTTSGGLPFPIPSGLLSGLGGGSSTGGGLPFPIPSGLLPPELAGLIGRDADGESSSKDRRQSLGGLLGGLTGAGGAGGAAAACAPVTVLFARGTDDPSLSGDNLGFIVGPGLQSDTTAALGQGQVSVQGVDYDASIVGIAEEAVAGGAGTAAMTKQLGDVLASCPTTKFVLSGYSQGGMIVHNTMGGLPADQAQKVLAAVTFGDPYCGVSPTGIADGKFKSYCATADPVCAASSITSPSVDGTGSASYASHLGYGSDTGAAAAFIKSVVSGGK